jgi:8-oxo-dGTP pyrophosphatase MutT (NUDIX family)
VSGKGGKRPGRQCAALPFVWDGGELRVLLVTSRETRRWVLPKGWMEKRLSPHALAAKEALEEAGVLGEVERRPVGRYDYLKRGPRDRVTPCSVRVFPLRVERLLDDWPERRQRQRRWFSPAEAAAAVEEGGLVALLLRLAVPRAEAAGPDDPRPADPAPAVASPHGNALEEDRDGRPHPSPGGRGEAHHVPRPVVEEIGAEEGRHRVDRPNDEDEDRDVPDDGSAGATRGLAAARRHVPHVRLRRDA